MQVRVDCLNLVQSGAFSGSLWIDCFVALSVIVCKTPYWKVYWTRKRGTVKRKLMRRFGCNHHRITSLHTIWIVPHLIEVVFDSKITENFLQTYRSCLVTFKFPRRFWVSNSIHLILNTAVRNLFTPLMSSDGCILRICSSLYTE